MPHQAQSYVLKHIRRFTILICGRRWGKSKLAALIGFIALLFPDKYIWIVAPTYSLTEKTWRIINKWCKTVGRGFFTITESERRITTPWGTTLECKSADNPDSLIGEGLDLLIIDEAARIKDVVWERDLRPTLSDRLGNAFIITTPRGKNWVKKLFLLGRSKDEKNKQYISFQFPTSTNPYIDKGEIEEAQRTLPEAVFKQEYLAEFVEDAGSVFRNIRKCANGKLQEPIAGVNYVASADLAKHEDFTVIMVARTDTREVVYHERFNQIDWVVQKQRIISVVQKYNARLIIDSTGVGDVVYDDLYAAGLDITGYKFTNQTKDILIQNLIAALDQELIHYPEDETLINELESYEYEMTRTKKIRYNAPEGMHDDEVIALALINQKLSEPSISFAFL